MTGNGRPGARVTDALRLVATTAALVAGLTILWRAGPALPLLPSDGLGWLRSLAEAEPLALAAGVTRLVALAVGAGLLTATVLGVAARGLGSVRLVARVDRWTPRALRRLLDGALGVGLATTIGLSALPAAADPGGTPPATLRRLPDAPSTTLRRLPDGPPTSATGPAAPEAQPSSAHAPPPVQPLGTAADGPRRGEVMVRPGDSFWRLAERHEAERLRRRPTETEVGHYWQHLVAANRHLLAVPGDADLLFPGQVLILP